MVREFDVGVDVDVGKVGAVGGVDATFGCVALMVVAVGVPPG